MCALPFQDTSKTLFRFVTDEARKTISRYWALTSTASLPGRSQEKSGFVRDSPLRPESEPTHGVRKRDRDRAKRVASEGGPKPSLRQRAVALVTRQGEVTTKELSAIGIPRCYLAKMCEEGLIVKVAYGRYRAADSRC